MANTCDDEQVNKNADRCEKDRGKQKKYARVDVTIVAVNGKTIDFVALGADGKSHLYKGLPWGDHETWSECPATLPPADGQLPAVGATGVLYLSDKVVADRKLYDIPKWPRSLSSLDPTAPLVVDATSLVLTGTTQVDKSETSVSIDLLDVSLAAVDQTIVIDGTHRLTVQLKPDGFDQLYLTFPMTIEHLKEAVATITERRHPKEIRRAWAVVEHFSTPRPDGMAPDSRVGDLLGQILER